MVMRSAGLGAFASVLLGCTSFGSSSDGTSGGSVTCAGQHAVCQDFDYGPPEVPWNLSSPAKVVSAPKPVVSAPNSLEAVIDPSQGVGFPIISVTLPSPTKHARCAAQVELTTVDTAGGGNILRIVTSDGMDSCN
jgi:hypothetical protein